MREGTPLLKALLIERSLPYRFNKALHFINIFWLIKLKLNCFFSKKIKVGLGPINSGEDNLAVRKWRIDPIVNQINKNNKRYVADIFLGDNH